MSEVSSDPRAFLREAVREAVERAQPLDATRRTLELLVETSVEVREQQGERRVVPVDALGEPREGVTLDDLVEELRVRHPALFKPAQSGSSPAQDPAVSRPPVRDWLDLCGTRAPASEEPEAPARHSPFTTLPEVGKERGSSRIGRLGALGAVGAVLLALAGWAAFHRPGPQGEARQAAASAEPSATGAVQALDSPRTLAGVPEVIDTATLSFTGRVVKLFGVEWARGAGEPGDLAGYLRGRRVECAREGASQSYRCRVDGQDLSRVVLYNGGGHPTAEATPDLRAAADRARERRAGVWANPTSAEAPDAPR